jgi:hypothetical protein
LSKRQQTEVNVHIPERVGLLPNAFDKFLVAGNRRQFLEFLFPGDCGSRRAVRFLGLIHGVAPMRSEFGGGSGSMQSVSTVRAWLKQISTGRTPG